MISSPSPSWAFNKLKVKKKFIKPHDICNIAT